VSNGFVRAQALREAWRSGARPGHDGPVKLLAGALLLIAAQASAIDGAPASIAPFSGGTPGAVPSPPWRATRLPKVPRETRYLLVEDGGMTVLRAEARASMSGLTHGLRIDPNATPMLEWRWKVSGVPAKGDIETRAGDDYSARLYVLFDYDLAKLPFAKRIGIRLARSLYGEAVPAAGLCYVWDARAPVGTTAWSAYTDRLRMIVVESGATKAGRWVSFRRNVADDYRAAFGEEPPAISGVAIATDTDNTGAEVTAWYGDIRLGTAP
jgi:hypothetical protein